MPPLEGSVTTVGDDSDVGYSIALPASIAADELILVEVESNRTDKCDATGEGFTELLAANDTTDARWIQLFAKKAAGGETTFNVDWNAVHFGGIVAVAHRISDWSGDLADLEVSAVDNATSSVACGSVTESGLVLRILGGKSCTYTPPAGVTLDENPAALSVANVELAVYTDDDNSTGSESFTVTSRQQAFTLVVPSGTPPMETISAVTVAGSLSIVAGGLDELAAVGAAVVPVTASPVAAAVIGSGTGTVAATIVEDALAVVAGAVTAPSTVTIGSAVVADAVAVVAGAVTATATVSPVVLTATASPVAPAVTGLGTAAVAAVTVADSLAVVAGAVTATGAAVIADRRVTVTASVQAGSLISIEHLGAAVVAVTGAIVAPSVNSRPVVDADYWIVIDTGPRWTATVAAPAVVVIDAAPRWTARPEEVST